LARADAAHRLDAAGDADVDGSRRVRPAINPFACWPLPHWQSTVIAPTCSGSPATSPQRRVMLLDCSPNCVTQPPTICNVAGFDAPLLGNAFCGAQQLGGVQAGRPSVPLADRATGEASTC
jgi:hypothetical protein